MANDPRGQEGEAAGVADLLLEIGTEELPAAFMEGALKQLEEKGRACLNGLRLAFGDLEVTGTPRRLVLAARGVARRQADRREAVRGPAAAAAFDAQGNPTPAARGFALGQGVEVASLRVEEAGGGRYVFADRVEEGRPARQVLAEALGGLVEGLEFPRSMRWGSGDARFARPVRWLVGLLGDEVLDFAAAGVGSGRISRGHRFLGGMVELQDAGSYADRMERAYVIVDHRRRREIIRGQVEEAALQAGGRVVMDEELLDEVTFLVEYPTAFVGSFTKDYLDLPREVLITPMKHHQRYFPVEGEDGRLLAHFVGVRNGGHDHLEMVVAGNEKVLRARLADARFFWEDDRSQRLAAYVAGLAQVTFHARLGSMLDKMERVRRLAARLVGWQGGGVDLAAWVDRAALLAKADLGTSMVYEFPELQGVMGREYARLGGEAPEVATAIYEHLLPRFAGDELPQSPAGAVLSVTDKADTIAGCFAAGLIPTGSQDPYALRRQALGILHILRRLDISLADLVSAALAGYEQVLPDLAGPDGAARVRDEVLEFFRGRLRGLLLDDGCRHEVIEAVLAAGFDRPAGVWARTRAVTDLLEGPEAADFLTVYRRSANLAQKAEGREVRPELLREDAEQSLAEALSTAAPRAQGAAAEGDFAGSFRAVAGLRVPLDAFLDRVMVMVEDGGVRQNRLALLALVADLCRLVADPSHLSASS